MALITCAECGHKISDQAAVCPSCGAPQKPVVTAQIDPAQYPNRLNDFSYRIEKDKSILAVNSRGEPFRFTDWQAFWKAANGQGVMPPPISPIPASIPAASPPARRFKYLVLLVGILALLVIAGKLLPSDDKKATSPANDEKASNCTSDWTKCTNNADLINHYSKMYEATSACKRALEQSVKFGDPEWTWGAFGSFRIGDDYPKTGLVKIIDTDVKIPNGFGAKAHSKVECWYDLNKKSATIMSIIER
jgi:hypothetical protein